MGINILNAIGDDQIFYFSILIAIQMVSYFQRIRATSLLIIVDKIAVTPCGDIWYYDFIKI